MWQEQIAAFEARRNALMTRVPVNPKTHERVLDWTRLRELWLDSAGWECCTRVLVRNGFVDVPKSWMNRSLSEDLEVCRLYS